MDPQSPSSDPDHIHVLMSSDDGFARPTMVAVHSLIRHLGAHRRITLHFAGFGVTPENESRIREIARDPRVSLDWMNPPVAAWMPPGPEKPGDPWCPPSQSIRLLACSMFPALDRILHLDVDIVVTGDIGELWDMPAPLPVSAVREVFFPTVRFCEWLDAQALGIDADAPYFNAGILVLNLALWRQEGAEEKLLDFYRRHWRRLKTQDQDALNAVFQFRWQRLPAAWNRPPWIDNVLHPGELGLDAAEFDQAKERPKIIHFAMPDKPWKSGIATPASRPFFAMVRELGLEPWGVARRNASTREVAWGLMMGATHRWRLRKAGNLSWGRFLRGHLAWILFHPVLSLSGHFLLLGRKLRSR